jgi:hypothetical protein
MPKGPKSGVKGLHVMNDLYYSLGESNLGFSAIFLAVSVSFLFLKFTAKNVAGSGHWCLSYLLNAVGFFLWSGVLKGVMPCAMLVGECFHIAGFLLLLFGVYRFCGFTLKPWNFLYLAAWFTLWGLGLCVVFSRDPSGSLLLRLARGVLFLSAAILLALREGKKEIGSLFTIISFCLWALYVVVMPFIPFGALKPLGYATLVGIQLIATLGLVILLVRGLVVQAETDKRQIERLEGLLHICSYCKKIHDTDDSWRGIEDYIERHSEAEFTHGICPECLHKHFPEYAEKLKRGES